MSISNPLIALICHGSADPRYQAVFAKLVQECQQELAPCPVRGGRLEGGSRTLAQQLTDWVDRGDIELNDSVKDHVKLVPLFIGRGIHLLQDIPAAVAEAQHQYPNLRVTVTEPVGHRPELILLLQQRIAAQAIRQPDTAWILFGHGSRSQTFAHDLGRVAQQLAMAQPGTVVQTAFWAQSPSLGDQVNFLRERGYPRIGLLPFLIFPGPIPDQLQVMGLEFMKRWPTLQIGVSAALAPDPLVVAAVRGCLGVC